MWKPAGIPAARNARCIRTALEEEVARPRSQDRGGKALGEVTEEGRDVRVGKVVAGGIEQVRGHEALGEDGVDAHVGVEGVTGLGQVEFGCEQDGGGG